MLSDDVLIGIGSGGQGYLTGYWREMTFIIKLVVDLKNRTTLDRQKLFDSYDDFVEWAATLPEGDARQFRHMLRYVAFPDRVERIASNNDRLIILERFSIAQKRQTKKWTDKAVDDALFKLRSEQQALYPDEILDFYEPPLKPKWKGEEELEASIQASALSPTLPQNFESILDQYLSARTSAPFAGNHPVCQFFENLKTTFAQIPAIRTGRT